MEKLALPTTTDRFAQRREHAVLTASQVFADKGFHGASTQDIAARLGIQQGSLYYYFKSKEEALEEVCLLGARGALAQLEEIVATDEPITSQLRAVFHRQLYGFRTHCHALIVFHEQRHHLSPEPRARVRAVSQRFRQLLQDTMARGVARGELKADLDCALATRALLGLCHSAASWHARDNSVDLVRVANHHADLFLGGAMAPTSSAEPPRPATVRRKAAGKRAATVR